ncbi:hypothetical protein RhiirA1_483681 [Rhizophagus irregularis]|uniref:Uncharacterized protein n=1 Tax=Rhizophagus irregularis TaxID=588596 RepID=A0A2N0QK81_9GLOM|nr:hypothetical protein RhiirA1_483681 [Rhizophagus irregularis]
MCFKIKKNDYQLSDISIIEINDDADKIDINNIDVDKNDVDKIFTLDNIDDKNTYFL